MMTTLSLGEKIGFAPACEMLVVVRSSFYRWKAEPMNLATSDASSRAIPARALSEGERTLVRAELHSERFVDKAPREVYATLLEEGVHLCHWRTMYRILSQDGEVRERRNQARQPHYARPELMASGPNRVWSWDITKLRGPVRGVWFFLYVIMDIFSRYVVGWLVAEHEREALAHELIDAACAKQGIQPGELTLHADRGSPMVSQTVNDLLNKLGVGKSHSRPHVSNDNPYSESGFKTMKYHPTFPDHFMSIDNSRGFCGPYFLWYNEEHHHTALALLTPATVHYGRTEAVLAQRQQVLDAAYAAHPERFPHGLPKVAVPPSTVWINAPAVADEPTHLVQGCLDSTPAPKVNQPGAEPGSRAGTSPSACPAQRTLDAGEHRAILSPEQAAGGVVMTPLQ